MSRVYSWYIRAITALKRWITEDRKSIVTAAGERTASATQISETIFSNAIPRGLRNSRCPTCSITIGATPAFVELEACLNFATATTGVASRIGVRATPSREGVAQETTICHTRSGARSLDCHVHRTRRGVIEASEVLILVWVRCRLSIV